MPTLPTEGPWTLPVADYEVLQVTFAYPLDIVAYGEEAASLLIRVESAFRLEHPDATSQDFDVSKEPWEALTPVLALRHDRVGSAVARSDGTMTISFASGRRISSWPDPNYENWQLTGPGFMLICTPGGEVAVFENGR